MVYDMKKEDFIYVNGGEEKLEGSMTDIIEDAEDLNERFPRAGTSIDR